MLKIACIQLTSSADLQENIVKIESMVAGAAGQGARFVATPENTFLMERTGGERVSYRQEEHPAVKASSEMAKKHGIWLLIGSISVAENNVQLSYNRSFLFNPKGEIAAHYDKIHLFDVEVGDGQAYRESSRIKAGDKVVVVDTEFGKLGMTICYDVRFPQLYNVLAKSGAQIITVPAAFTEVTGKAHWHVLLRARAIETGCFIVAPAQTGTHAGGRKTYGHSLIINPWGEIITDGGVDEGIIMADLDLSEVNNVRAKIPSLKHGVNFYKDKLC